MKLTKKHLGVGAVAIGAVLAFALPAGAAVNLQSESSGTSVAKIARTAQLKARGAATVVTLDITCPAGSQFNASIQVTEVLGSTTTASGYGNVDSQNCTGTTQKVKIPALANAAPFVVGNAYAVGHVNVYGFNYTELDLGRVIVNVNG